MGCSDAMLSWRLLSRLPADHYEPQLALSKSTINFSSMSPILCEVALAHFQLKTWAVTSVSGLTGRWTTGCLHSHSEVNGDNLAGMHKGSQLWN